MTLDRSTKTEPTEWLINTSKSFLWLSSPGNYFPKNKNRREPPQFRLLHLYGPGLDLRGAITLHFCCHSFDFRSGPELRAAVKFQCILQYVFSDGEVVIQNECKFYGILRIWTKLITGWMNTDSTVKCQLYHCRRIRTNTNKGTELSPAPSLPFYHHQTSVQEMQFDWFALNGIVKSLWPWSHICVQYDFYDGIIPGCISAKSFPFEIEFCSQWDQPWGDMQRWSGWNGVGDLQCGQHVCTIQQFSKWRSYIIFPPQGCSPPRWKQREVRGKIKAGELPGTGKLLLMETHRFLISLFLCLLFSSEPLLFPPQYPVYGCVHEWHGVTKRKRNSAMDINIFMFHGVCQCFYTSTLLVLVLLVQITWRLPHRRAVPEHQILPLFLS